MDHYLQLLASRAQFLALLVAMGYGAGSFFARGPFLRALEAGDNAVRSLARKLDRQHRGVATLIYRGIVAVMVLLIPAILAGALLSKPLPWMPLLTGAILITWFGHCFATLPSIALWRRARNDGLPLQIPELHYLFADSHAVIRHLITTRMDAFAVGVVGGCFWYVIGGPMLMAIYLTLAAAAAAYRPFLAFGWAARGLFALMDCLPRFISRLLLAVAAIFPPHCKPLSGLLAPNWHTAMANTLDIALSHHMTGDQITWVGKGTARLTHQHLRRTLHLLLAATMLLLMMLTSPTAYKLLIKII